MQVAKLLVSPQRRVCDRSATLYIVFINIVYNQVSTASGILSGVFHTNKRVIIGWGCEGGLAREYVGSKGEVKKR
jgi:hypothetical protein